MKKRIILMMIAVLIVSAAPAMTKQADAASPDEISAYAQKFLGTPYKFGGTTPAGFDCSGYILYVYKHFGISLPRTSAEQAKVGSAVAKKDLKKGDLVFFANTYKKGVSHTGIYIGNGNVISAESGGVEISNINTNPYWAPKYHSARRVTTAVAAAVSDGNFKDVASSDRAYPAIKAMNQSGIVNGFPGGVFKPNDKVTRAQAAEMINRVLKLKQKQPSKFSDVGSTHRFANSINAMQEAGILQGYSNGKYGVNDPLSKAQLAIILERAFKITNYEENQVQTASVFYHDVKPAYWAHDAIVALKAIDQTTVFQTSSYNVDANASRAHFTAALYSAIEAQ